MNDRENEYYRKKIFDIVNKCNDTHWLKVIYAYLSKLLK